MLALALMGRRFREASPIAQIQPKTLPDDVFPIESSQLRHLEETPVVSGQLNAHPCAGTVRSLGFHEFVLPHCSNS